MLIIDWILRFIGLACILAFQVLVLNQLEVGKYLHPYVFPMFIFMLPITTPRWIVLLLAFITGLIVDMFNNTTGMQAAACVAMAFSRPFVLHFLTPPTGYDAIVSPNIKYLGFTWFAIYATIMLFLHHTIYFFVEMMSFRQLGYTFLKILLSGIISTCLVLILTFLFTAKDERS
jgi:hypothetical protein